MIKYLIAAFVLFLTIPAQAEDRWMSIPPAPPMPEAASSGTVNVNGINMYHAIYGDAEGTPILLIHGGLAHGDIWATQVADLMQDHKVIVADTRGHGRSTNDGSEYTYTRLAADYLSLLDQIGVDRVHLVGWSDGANIGYSISQTNPERLASHFAHAGNITLDGVDPSVETNEVFGTYVGMMAGDYAEMSPTPDEFEIFLGAVAKMWGSSKPGGPDALKSVTVPTLVVQSEFDEAILMDHSKMIAEIMPSADFLILEDVSHFASFQAADEYTDAIRKFIER
ncbi:alpha/beta hydrolase [Labrenzia sp. DG1229]|uniref:alpha/beta fold hydrolase n=1 Tax=Labrenzia sp. DG1229 TaxID=681847 RepID=UPI000490FEB8|nr:alpha/beta hydrolase [Labrenzia sp. DG1229]